MAKRDETITAVVLLEHEDYRTYLKALLESRGRGSLGRLARAMQVSPTLVSLIVRGEKNLTPEQAFALCEYLGFSEWETDYFTQLVELSRAGTLGLQNRLKKKLQTLRQQGNKLVKRVKVEKELSDESATLFYSSWHYAAIRNYAALGNFKSPNEIAERFHLPLVQVNAIIHFLLSQGLLKEGKRGLESGHKSTHLSVDSPFANHHHRNWRLRAMDQMDLKRESDLFYTCTMSLSHKDAEYLRTLLPKFIRQVLDIVGPSESEKVMCWNMDWFEY